MSLLKLIPLAPLVLFASCSTNGDSHAAESSDGDGTDATDTADTAAWVSLGSVEHWRGYKKEDVPEGWAIEDGTIHLAGSGAGDLITREQFESFELELEWKISPNGNSGIMYHVSEGDGATYMTGPEMQVLDNAALGDSTDLLHAAGADYALYAPGEDNSKPAGEWNSARIVVDGPNVTYWLNGVEQVSYELWSDEWEERVANSKFKEWPDFGRNKTGFIALQDHGNEVWYRNVRIRVL